MKRKNRGRVAAIALATVLGAASLSGCGGEREETTSSKEEQTLATLVGDGAGKSLGAEDEDGGTSDGGSRDDGTSQGSASEEGGPQEDYSEGDGSQENSRGNGSQDNQSKGDGSQGDASQSGNSQENKNSDRAEHKTSGYRFSSAEQAKAIMELGLAEYRGLNNADMQFRYGTAIENRYINQYLIPYLEVLSEEQVVIDPDSIDSKWFPAANPDMAGRLNSSYGNIYRKMAQDMLPYMLPDPDVALMQIGRLFGQADPSGQELDVLDLQQDYQDYLDSYDFVHNTLPTTDYGTFWEDFLYEGDSYGFSDGKLTGTVGFSCPRYNRQYLVNLLVFGENADEGHRQAIQPYSSATNLLSEIQYAREKGGANNELYYQDIYISVTGEPAAAKQRLYEIFKILQPYCSDSERYERFQRIQEPSPYRTLLIRRHENTFRFDPYLEYFKEQDYSFRAPVLYGAYEKFSGAGYRVDVNDFFINGTADSFVNFSMSDSGGTDGKTTYNLTVHVGGRDIMPTNLYRNSEIFYQVNKQVSMGVFYPLLAPAYYSEAVRSGYFTPYVIPEERAEENIPIAPIYGKPKKETTLADYYGLNERKNMDRATGWLTSGFGDDAHDFPPGALPREPKDLSALGYYKDADGNWNRNMQTKSPGESYVLTYDETGLLISGKRTFDGAGTIEYTYKTDVDGNPAYSIDRMYDVHGIMEEQAITQYHKDGGKTTTTYENQLRSGEVNYKKTYEAGFSSNGEVTNFVSYQNDGETPSLQITVSEFDIAGGKLGDVQTDHVQRVTTTRYDESGTVISSENEDTVLSTESQEYSKDPLRRHVEELIWQREKHW